MNNKTTTKIILVSSMIICSGCTTIRVEQRESWINSTTVTNRRPAVVEILSNGQIRGTGAFISSNGLVLTASHLFKHDRIKVEVVTSNGVHYKAKLLRRHRGADIALVQIINSTREFPYFTLAGSMPALGEHVACFGAALWNPVMLLTGQMANSDDNYCEFPNSNGYVNCSFITASIPGLVSGGPWINSDGEIFGVQSGHLLDNGVDAGISMVAHLKSIKQLLYARKSIRTAGIQAWVWPLWTTDQTIIDSYPRGTNGLLVSRLHSNSTLATSGIRPHELIISCEGREMVRRVDFLRIIKSKRPGETVRVKVMSKRGTVRSVRFRLADTETGHL